MYLPVISTPSEARGTHLLAAHLAAPVAFHPAANGCLHWQQQAERLIPKAAIACHTQQDLFMLVKVDLSCRRSWFMFFRVAQLTPYIAMPGFRFEEAHRVGAHHERLPISGFQSVCTTQSQVLRLRLDPSSITSSTDLQSFLLSVSSLLEDKVRYSVFHRIQYGMQTALSAVQRADPWRTAACSCFPLRRVFLKML